MWTVHCPISQWLVNTLDREMICSTSLNVSWQHFFLPNHLSRECLFIFNLVKWNYLQPYAWTPHRCSGGHTPVTSKQGISSMCSGCLHMAQVMVDWVAPHGYPLNPMTFTIDIETRRNKVLCSIWVTLEQMEKTPSATNQTETQHPDC